MLLKRRLFAALLITGGLVLQAAEVPRPSPDFPIKFPAGKVGNINDYKGKILFVEFLLVTCPHCQNAARVMSKLQDEYRSKGVQMLGLSIDPKADVQHFVQLTGANFPVGAATTDMAVYGYLQHSIMNARTFTVPQVVVIDRKGVIREQHGGPDDTYLLNEDANFRKSIEDALRAEPAARTSARSSNSGTRSRKRQ